MLASRCDNVSLREIEGIDALLSHKRTSHCDRLLSNTSLKIVVWSRLSLGAEYCMSGVFLKLGRCLLESVVWRGDTNAIIPR